MREISPTKASSTGLPAPISDFPASPRVTPHRQPMRLSTGRRRRKVLGPPIPRQAYVCCQIPKISFVSQHRDAGTARWLPTIREQPLNEGIDRMLEQGLTLPVYSHKWDDLNRLSWAHLKEQKGWTGCSSREWWTYRGMQGPTCGDGEGHEPRRVAGAVPSSWVRSVEYSLGGSFRTTVLKLVSWVNKISLSPHTGYEVNSML